MKSYAKYIGKRILYMAITLFLIASITFFLMKALPGTPYSNQDKLSEEQIFIMNEKYGLNKPILVQYAVYIFGLLRGDMGVSFQFNNTPVTDLLSSRIGPSMQLGLQAVIIGTILGIVLGVIAAMRQGTWVDTVATLTAIVGRSIPNFVFAVILQLVFGVWLNSVPGCGP